MGRGRLTGRQAAAAGGGAGLVAARIPGYKHGAEGRAGARGQVGGREQQTPPPGPAPSRSGSAFAATGVGSGPGLSLPPRPSPFPPSLLPTQLPTHPPRQSPALAAGSGGSPGRGSGWNPCDDRVTSPPARLAAWPVGKAQALRCGSGIKVPQAREFHAHFCPVVAFLQTSKPLPSPLSSPREPEPIVLVRKLRWRWP